MELMYEQIVRLIDARIERLRLARQILSSSEPLEVESLSEAPLSHDERNAASDERPNSSPTPTRKVRQKSPRARRIRTQAAVAPVHTAAAALSASIPTKPVFVPAAVVKAQTARPERVLVVAPPAPQEGTLESLVRDLTDRGVAQLSALPRGL